MSRGSYGLKLLSRGSYGPQQEVRETKLQAESIEEQLVESFERECGGVEGFSLVETLRFEPSIA